MKLPGKANAVSASFLYWFIGFLFLIPGGLAQAMPAASDPVGPIGSTTDTTPTYVFSEVTTSTWYQLWVQDATGIKVNQWFTTANSNCSAGTCSITPETVVNGTISWWVRTWNNTGIGPWSIRGTFTVGAPPPAATLIGPDGNTNDETPTYSWNAVTDSTWYQLWVNNAANVPVVQTWYTAAQAGCANGTGTCAVTPSDQLVSGAHQYWIRTWSSSGYGPWSSSIQFNVTGGDPSLVACNAPSAQVQQAMHAALNNLRSTPTFCPNENGGQGVQHPARPALALNQLLANASQTHSNDMATNNFLSHTGSDGSNFSARAFAAGYNPDYPQSPAPLPRWETLAAGSSTVGGAISQWVGSATGHCSALMSSSSDEMGGACSQDVNSQYSNYWTIVGGCSNLDCVFGNE